jgi:hypothetical protein
MHSKIKLRGVFYAPRKTIVILILLRLRSTFKIIFKIHIIHQWYVKQIKITYFI